MSKEELQKENTELHNQNTELRNQNTVLQQENAQLKKMIFGAKRERFAPDVLPGQMALFAQQLSTEVEPEPEVVVRQKKKKKAKKTVVKRNTFPADLPREETLILPEGETEHLTRIGEDVTELLAYRPASLHVKKIVRPRFVDKSDEDKGVMQASIPPRTVPRGMVDESLIAQIIVDKIQFHTPIHRFRKKLKQAGIDFIRENNLYNWFHAGAESLLPIYNLMVEQVTGRSYMMADETRMIVLAKNKVGASHRGQMWAFYSPELNVLVFNYEPTRSEESANVIIDKFSGILQVDGFCVYENIAKKRKDIRLAYCHSHSRRKFYDALPTAPDLAAFYLQRIKQLYEIEQRARDQNMNVDQRLKLRQAESVPILEELRAWLLEQYPDKTLLPSSPIRKAINYAFIRWEDLCLFAHDGRIEIDNNLVEGTIRPIALGRNNYMFAGSHDAAQNLAVLYSIVGTCLKHDINVNKYIHWLLIQVANNKVTPDAVNWLPHRIDPQILEDFQG